jgi:AcrR family transcriptional regulator
MSGRSETVDEEALGDPWGEERVHRFLVRELGEELAEMFGRARHAQEVFEQQRRPDEGLRERKRRLTRQRISDVATTMFFSRGFDSVRVSDVAEVVGVSEKTIYNYFPTKESMVLDTEDEIVESLTRALRERDPGESLTEAVVRAVAQDMARFDELPDELVALFPRFGEVIRSTPSLRAAWLDLQNRLVEVARQELAARADIDPRDPEPMIAARALVGLGQVAFEARMRHIAEGLRGPELRDAVAADLERAGRLLETGLWSFNLMTQGRRTRQQFLEAAKAADEARAQVLKALRQARAAWRQLRDQR